MTTTAWLAPVRHLSPDSFELYLERQAARGRHVAGIDGLSPLRLHFDDAEPATVRYVVDRRANPAPIDYYTFRENLGWEHVGVVADLHLWRREYHGERPASFVGDDIYRRAGTWSVALAAVAALTLLGAVALGILAAVDPVTGASPRDFWAPAIALAVVGVASAVVSLQLSVSHYAASRSQTVAIQPDGF
ncbi:MULTISPECIES: DUF2812 domain-containing protein [unclassified Gordonia (in: high G+C Gram-positive bacteria)]|uniref:DUF2812 domain-containing protein n=1 Tax=unclassified Gordonia (in: high G+C Gram-positive bacteria) TaxID=2657482 RepID=UPI001FFEBFB4|nr:MULTISPECIES: DUF2812 domain-containing protein [unclassified Gordonia (in: high G+C Gram-positive bacteria)]UQE75141.1 DUF2812 domain-containing protein [Gordonia sp. PP30]